MSRIFDSSEIPDSSHPDHPSLPSIPLMPASSYNLGKTSTVFKLKKRNHGTWPEDDSYR